MSNKNNKDRGTELIWQGKYRDDGSLNLPGKVSWPFQTIETVNESKVDRERMQKSLGFERKEAGPWRNRLIWGDNKYIMSSLLSEFAGKINLIYIDPPFATGADFSYKVEVGSEEVTKEPSMIEEVAYRDTWGKGMDSYLQMIFERLILMRELLTDDGSIYVHLDETVGHYVKVLMDEIFGSESFQREIIWRIGWISGYKSAAKNWIRNHDTLLFYNKTRGKFTFNKLYIPYPPGYKRRGGEEPTGKGYPIEDVWNANPFEFDLKGEESLDSIQIKSFSTEKTGFATQKNESLVKRIIEASSNEDDLIADFFCGSGTTGAVAEKLGRRWILADLSRFAIQTTRKRLLQIENCSPFVVQNLGKYERQYWYSAFGSESAEGKRRDYQETILKFYRAEPVKGYKHIHGTKGKSVVSVGELDVPVTLEQVEDIIKECLRAKQDRVDMLGWEFEMGLDVEIENRNKKSPVKVRLLRIPKEVMDPKYAGKIEFYDLGALNLNMEIRDGNVEIEIESFHIPYLELVKEEEIRQKIKHWQDYIDYWAIDWNYRDDTFHNEWQEFRTRKTPKLKLKASSKDSARGQKYYQEPGSYKNLVKVIDIFGNDTTRLIEVHIK